MVGLAEFRWELFGDSACQGVGNRVHMLLHCGPGLRLFSILFVMQLLDLLHVVAAVSQQQRTQCGDRKIGVGPTQENGDLFCISS